MLKRFFVINPWQPSSYTAKHKGVRNTIGIKYNIELHIAADV